MFTSQFSKPWSIRYSVDKWSIQRFRGNSRSVEAHNGRLNRRETGIQIGKSENHIGNQIWRPIRQVFMTKTENYMLKDGKSIMNTQSEKPKFFGTKTDLKKISKIPMPPLRMNRSVQSINHTNDNTTTIIIIETSTKTFLSLYSETCCKTTLVTRYFLRKVSCHANELFIDYELTNTEEDLISART